MPLSQARSLATSRASGAPPAHLSLVRSDQMAQQYQRHSKSDNTLRAYKSDWADFEQWCSSRSVLALAAAPDVIASYLADLASSRKTGTVERRLTAIAYMKGKAGQARPSIDASVRDTLRGIRRVNGMRQDGKDALSVFLVREMVEGLPPSLAGARDRALILLGFAGALRRSELVGLDVGDIREVPEGLVVKIRRSKTDQVGQGEEVGIVYGSSAVTCPVRAFRAWLNVSGITDGAAFRPIDRHNNLGRSRLSGYAVTLVVQRAASHTGMTDEEVQRLGAHSLRSGHATTAARAGIEERSIAAQGRWRTAKSVRAYIKHGSLFVENSSAHLGL